MRITKKELNKSIKKIVNYLWKDEKKNFEEFDGCLYLEDHILYDIKILKTYLKQSNARNNKKS